MATGRKFGWHSGTLNCKDAKIKGDLYVQDDIVFSDVSAGVLGITGGIDMQSTVSAIGIDMGGTFATAAINIDGTCSTAGIVMAGDTAYNPIHIGTKANTAVGGLNMNGQDSYDNHGGIMMFCDDGGVALATTYTTSAIWTRYLITADQTSNTATGAYLQMKTVGARTFTSCDYSATKLYFECSGGGTLASGNLFVLNTTLDFGDDFENAAGMLAGIHVEINDNANTITDTAVNTSGILIRKNGSSTLGWAVGLNIEASGAVTGIKIGTCTTGIHFSGTITAGIDFADITLTPNSTRTNYAIGVGDRNDELTVNLANAASQNFDPIQMNINLTATGGAPTSTSTVNLIYQQITHDTVDMPNVRLKGCDWTITTDKACQDAYVIQTELIVSGTKTSSGELMAISALTTLGSGARTADRVLAFQAMINGSGTAGTVTGDAIVGYFVNAGTVVTTDSIIELKNQSAATCASAITLDLDGTVTRAFDFQGTVSDGWTAGDAAVTQADEYVKIPVRVAGVTPVLYLLAAETWA